MPDITHYICVKVLEIQNLIRGLSKGRQYGLAVVHVSVVETSDHTSPLCKFR